MPTIEGVVAFADAPREPLTGTLRVRLVDVARADADAVVLDEVTLADTTVGPVATRHRFRLEAAEVAPNALLAIEAHLDVDGSRETSVGDYRTMEHFGVPARASAADSPCEVVVRRVR